MAYERLEDLRIYREAVEIAEATWEEVAKWKYFERDVVGKQLVDAADSINANIAESYGRTGTKDVINFLIYARGSMYETKDRLGKAVRRGLLPPDCGSAIQHRLESLAPALSAYITSKRRSLTQRSKT
jgi:four helix bundle protein